MVPFMKIILFFLIYSIHISIISANDLKKMALDGDPVSICKYAQELRGEEKNKLFKHSYLLGNISCKEATGHNKFKSSHDLVIIEDTEKTAKEIIAEANNDSNKQFLLWTLYANGYDVSKLTAFTWLKVAAENKHPAALMVLGTLYCFGYIVSEDKDKGVKLIQESADLQYPLAKDFLKQLNI
jgi:TPR repeat protein